MRHIDRLPKPSILRDKQAEWQEKYEERLAENPRARPDNSKYAHKEIKDALYAMSYGKCFYCETRLSGGNKEVDHFIEVAIDHSKAYDWDNLYLACSNCNDKMDHAAIPVTDALDPCRDSDEEIQRNVTYVDEQISAVPSSQKGLNTIKKFKLNTELLDMRRGQWLKKLLKTVADIQGVMIEEGRKTVTDAEKKTLLRYMSPDQPYSLMSEVYLKTHFAKMIA
jgi:uncharacterized protein (TIGR02646 family)